MYKLRTFVILPVLAIFSACSVETSEPEPSGAAQEPLLTRTIVRVADDGTEEVTVEFATQAELDAELRLHKEQKATGGTISQPIAQDSGCAGSSLWMHDQTNQNGNRICFYGSGQTNFGGLCRVKIGSVCVAIWSAAVRSLWAGVDTGAMGVGWTPIACCGGYCNPGFGSYQRRDTLNTCEHGSSSVFLNGVCMPC